MDDKKDLNNRSLGCSRLIESAMKSYKTVENAMKPYKAVEEALNAMSLPQKVLNMNSISNVPKLDTRNYNYADFKYEKIKEEVESFQNSLTDEFDVMVQMASFGKEIIMVVEDIGYQNPDILYFWGTIHGQKAQLIQHQSQLNFLLLACKKEDPKAKPHRIGFVTLQEDEDNECEE